MLTQLRRLVLRHDASVARALSTPAATDPVVVAAHRLLASLEPAMCPPLDVVHVGDVPGLEGACFDGRIVVNPAGAFYRAAARGDLLRLAMLLHHEQWHALNGGDERRARAASCRFIQAHFPPRPDLARHFLEDTNDL